MFIKQLMRYLTCATIVLSPITIQAYANVQLPAPQQSHLQPKLPKPTPHVLPKPIRSTQVLDSIVAYVNNDIVTQEELNQAIKRATQMIAKSGQPAPSDAVLHKQILQQLIYQKLQLQLAKRSGLTASEDQVTNAINHLAKQRHISVAKLYKQVQRQGYTKKSFRKEVNNEILISQMQQQSVSKDVVVNQKDVASFYQKYKQQAQQAIKYNVVDILIALPEAPSKAQLHAANIKARQILKRLHKGEKANQIATHYTDVTVNALGSQSAGNLPQLFIDQLVHMKKNGIAGPLRAANGLHLIKLLGTNKSSIKMPTKTQVESYLFEKQYQIKLQKWLKGLKKNAYIKIVNP